MKFKLFSTIIVAASVSMLGISSAIAQPDTVVVKKTTVPVSGSLKVHKHKKVYVHDNGVVTKKVIVKKHMQPTPVKKVIVKERTY